MTPLTRRTFIQAETVTIGGASFALPGFLPLVNAQARDKEQSMYMTISQVRFTPGAESEAMARVQQSFVPMLRKEPDLLGYYLVHAPDPYNELTLISIFLRMMLQQKHPFTKP